MNLLAEGSAWLTERRHESLSHAITYTRGAYSVTLDATVGTAYDEHVDESGVVQRIDHREYLFQTADLILNGSAALPAHGDRITEVINSKSCTFEVTANGGNSPWRYSDAERNTIRVRVKLVGEAAV